MKKILSKAWAWLGRFWWPLLLLVQIPLIFRWRHVDDGDPTITMRFGSWVDLALVVCLVAALALEARKGAVALLRWWRGRKGRANGERLAREMAALPWVTRATWDARHNRLDLTVQPPVYLDRIEVEACTIEGEVRG